MVPAVCLRQMNVTEDGQEQRSVTCRSATGSQVPDHADTCMSADITWTWHAAGNSTSGACHAWLLTLEHDQAGRAQVERPHVKVAACKYMFGISHPATVPIVNKKISPVGDWRSTSLEWPWPWHWFRPNGIPSCITHRPLPTYQISLSSEEKNFWRSPLRFWSSSESRDTKTTTNIKNPARSNLDIVL